MIGAFKKLVFTDDLINRMQDNLLSLFDGLKQDKFLSRKTVTASLLPGSNVVYHTLGRVPSGWIVSDKTGSATLWRTAWDTQTITVEIAGFAMTVTLEVF
jgi:hypothetical protein